MAIHLRSTQEQQLGELSAANGIGMDELAQQAIDQFLTYRTRLEASVQTGREAAARGELVEHEEVVARMERLLTS